MSLLLLVLLAPSWAAARGTFEQIVVFGTSLSDPGNAFALLNDPAFRLDQPHNVPPYDQLDEYLVPDSPYAKGGHHFSNGATWIEQYAHGQGFAGDVRPAFQGNSLKATNYAVGGTRARDVSGEVTLSYQVNAFLEPRNGQAPSAALYVIEIGSNDVRDALAAYPATSGQIISSSLTAINENLGKLYEAGARQFFVLNVPDIGLTPAVQALDKLIPGLALVATGLTNSFNAGLDTVLGTWAGFNGVEIAQLDVYAKVNDIYNNPGNFGLSNVMSPCLTPRQPPFTCQMPDQYLFWDGIHPTQAAHAILAHEAATVIAAQ
jgi:phospholipase/lecithinase/hemolysin